MRDFLPPQPIRRIANLFLAGFCALILWTSYWSVYKKAALLTRADNPYPILAEQRIFRGTIFDKNWQPLALTLGNPDSYTRQYPLAAAGAVVGYHSLNYGDTGLEATFAAKLNGSSERSTLSYWWEQQVLDRPLKGSSVRTFLDSKLQEQSYRILQGHVGAIVLLQPSNGAILAIVSNPTFDPNRIATDWDMLIGSPEKRLIQRATQGLYPARQIFYPIFLALARNYQQPLPSRDPVHFLALGRTLGAGFDSFWHDLGLDAAISLPIATAAPVYPADWLNGEAQATALLSPLHLAQVAASFANAGQRVPLRLVHQLQYPESGYWQDVATNGIPVSVLPSEIIQASHVHLQEAEQWLGYAATEQSGTQTVGWHWGYRKTGDLAWAVLIENSDATGATAVVNALLAKLK
jgi:cell division protein FtsI/penicillin-binding protein 2